MELSYTHPTKEKMDSEMLSNLLKATLLLSRGAPLRSGPRPALTADAHGSVLSLRSENSLPFLCPGFSPKAQSLTPSPLLDVSPARTGTRMSQASQDNVSHYKLECMICPPNLPVLPVPSSGTLQGLQ